MKELIVKIRTNKLSLHKNLVIGKKNITEIKDIAEELSNFLTNVGLKKSQNFETHSLVS